MRVLMITNKVKTYALGFQNVLVPLRELGHEVVWAADFSNFVGDKTSIPCVTEHISINTNPLNPTNRTALKQVCKIINKYDIQAIQCSTRCGMPRNEELWLADDEKKTLMREKLGLPVDKKVILYAPTWRESTDGGKSYEIKPPIHFDVWKKELGSEYIVLFRAHHQTTKVLGVKYDDFVRDASDYPAVNDLMIASDMLITDYSAIAFDYAVLCKPIFCYAYDYETYLAERGTYFDIDDRYPNKSCRTEDELLSRIKSIDYELECSNTRRFRDEFIQYGVGATESCVKAEFGR